MGPWQLCKNCAGRKEMGIPETLRASGRHKITRATHRAGENWSDSGREGLLPPGLLTAL